MSDSDFRGVFASLLQDVPISKNSERAERVSGFLSSLEKSKCFQAPLSGQEMAKVLEGLPSLVLPGEFGMFSKWLPWVQKRKHFGTVREVIGDRLARLSAPFAFNERKSFCLLSENSLPFKGIPNSVSMHDQSCFLSKFGFSSLSFPLEMEEVFRRVRIDELDRILSLLASNLNVSFKQIGLSGLSIAFSSMESYRAGCFWAFPEEISIAKDRHEFVIHEWWHALDFFFGSKNIPLSEMASKKEPASWYPHKNLWKAMRDFQLTVKNIRPDEEMIFCDLVAIFADVVIEDFEVRLLQNGFDFFSAGWRAREMADRVIPFAINNDWKGASEIYSSLVSEFDRVQGRGQVVEFLGKGNLLSNSARPDRSIFYDFAMRADMTQKGGRYWSSSVEMFARFMESWFWTTSYGLPYHKARRLEVLDVASPIPCEIRAMSDSVGNLIQEFGAAIQAST